MLSERSYPVGRLVRESLAVVRLPSSVAQTQGQTLDAAAPFSVVAADHQAMLESGNGRTLLVDRSRHNDRMACEKVLNRLFAQVEGFLVQHGFLENEP